MKIQKTWKCVKSKNETGFRERKMLKNLSVAALVLIFSCSAHAGKQSPTIDVAQVNAKVVGSCNIYDPQDAYANSLSPIGAIGAYVQNYQRSYLRELQKNEYTVNYVERPSNGVIKLVIHDGNVRTHFIPNPGFKGNDRYVAEVVARGTVFKVVGYLRASSDEVSDYDQLCRRLGLPSSAWKISQSDLAP